MNQRLLLATLGAGVFGLGACAHTVPVEGGATPSTSVAAAPGSGRWSGRISSVTQNRADVAQSTRDNSYGQAEWTRGDGGPTLSSVNLVFTYAGQDRELTWAIVAGSCGVAALPLIPLSNFPELSIGSGGRAQVTASLPIDLPSTGTYHIDIYRDRSGGAESLVGCGNLRYSH
jgi:hypothetical protein